MTENTIRTIAVLIVFFVVAQEEIHPVLTHSLNTRNIDFNIEG